MLKDIPQSLFSRLDDALSRTRPELETGEVGRVRSVGEGVASVTGFTDLHANELVRFEGGLIGLAASLGLRETGVIVLGDADALRTDEMVRRLKRVADTPVGEGLLGRVVDALGRPLDGKGRLKAEERRAVEQPAAPIIHRAPVDVPLQTGIKAIDAAIPIGRGQRELILGDRQTGKTAIAVDTILNQRGTGVTSVYCAIGQRASAVARVVQALEKTHTLERTVVVVAGGDDAPGLQWLAPYTATTIAEHFMAGGGDALIVYDDLTRHARAYRELSLLLRRPPGREAYPGDIFYIHARLLERSTRLRRELGGGSLTALPIIETQAQNISAYIPTNLISITDGQIYLSPSLFEKGHLPAIDIGKSVSRVGGKAQLPAYRAVAGTLRLSYAQFEELETFARFGTRLDEDTRRKLERGRRVREVLKQREHQHLTVSEQIAVLLAATEGLFDQLPVAHLARAQNAVCALMRQDPGGIGKPIEDGERLDREDRDKLLHAISDVLAQAGWRAGEDENDGGNSGGNA